MMFSESQLPGAENETKTNSHSAPAFTSVATRTTFSRPTMPSNGATVAPTLMASQPQPKPRTWPEPVRRYVQRAFAEGNTIEGIDRSEIETKLKEVISRAAETNTLDGIDWDNLLLPQQIIQKEHAQVRMLPPQGLPPVRALTLQDTNVQSSSKSKKRKSDDISAPQSEQNLVRSPPWRTATHGKSQDPRLSKPNKRQKNGLHPDSPTRLGTTDLEKRRERFQHSTKAVANGTGNRELDPEIITRGPVVGRCHELEKKYLRLTSAPNPDFVRPLPVLQKTLDLLKRKWRDEGNYGYICDQFKSLRQDLTVQHIKTDFTVNVYEIHARIALEKGDLGEYNQCQTQLRTLYTQNLGGHPVEFKAYRILYFLYTCNRIDLNDLLSDLTQAEKKEPAIKHALDTRSAMALSNYHRFFKLYLETPNMGAYLMDMFVARERLAALAHMCRAYKPDIRVRIVTEELGFESDSDAVRFICENSGESLLEQRDNGDIFFLTGKAGSLFEDARRAAFKSIDIKGQI